MIVVLRKCIVFSLFLVLSVGVFFILAELELTHATNYGSPKASFYGFKDLIHEEQYEEKYDIGGKQAKFWGVPRF